MMPFLLVALVGCGSESQKPGKKIEERPSVIVETVSEAESDRVVARGVTRFLRSPSLSFKASGIVASVDVDRGDYVRAGQIVARLNRIETDASENQAKADYDLAARDFDRAKKVFDQGFLTVAAMDAAQSRLDRARAGLSAARFNAQSSTLRAPADGIVLERNVEPGETVASGTPLFTIGAAKSGFVADVFVPLRDIGRLRKGGTCALAASGSDSVSLNGRILSIGIDGDAVSGGYPVRISLPIDRGVRAGVPILARCTASDQDSGNTSIPISALLSGRADQGTVFVVGADGVARQRPVVTSGIRGDRIVVTSGLKAGERVVTVGAAYLADGTKVTLFKGQE
jgi:RND family efflux transporter MFP subunit